MKLIPINPYDPMDKRSTGNLVWINPSQIVSVSESQNIIAGTPPILRINVAGISEFILTIMPSGEFAEQFALATQEERIG